jgi:hypothetical protein
MSSDARGGPRRVAALCLALAMGGVCSVGGCTSHKKHSKGKPPAAWEQQRTARSSTGQRPDQVTDPCATRMHDLSGLLLLYYAVNKKLPERLDELEPFADADMPFQAECPLSGVPYVYVPTAVPPAGSERFLVIYDAVPAHGGLRWGVFITPPVNNQPPETRVLPMSETVFRNYVPR